jgi:hypothetical protein
MPGLKALVFIPGLNAFWFIPPLVVGIAGVHAGIIGVGIHAGVVGVRVHARIECILVHAWRYGGVLVHARVGIESSLVGVESSLIGVPVVVHFNEYLQGQSVSI